jgi:hypothetical protein
MQPQTQAKPQTNTAPQQRKPAPAKPDPAVIDRIIAETCDKIDDRAHRYSDDMASAKSHLRRAMILARATDDMEALFGKEIMEMILKLENRQGGFMTDKTGRGGEKDYYSVEEIKRCAIQAVVWGCYFTGNEWNIISGRCYRTGAFWERKVREIPGVSDLDLVPGVPRLIDGRTVVRVAASWKVGERAGRLIGADGQPGVAFSIRVNAGMSDDAVVGKARAKAWRLIYEKETGSIRTEDDEPEERATNGSQAALPAAAPAPQQQAAPAGRTISQRELDRIQDAMKRSNAHDCSLLLEKYGGDETRLTEEQGRMFLSEVLALVEIDQPRGDAAE